MSSNLNQREAAIRAAMQNATLSEQRRLAGELDKIASVRQAQNSRSHEVDLAARQVRNTLSPVLVHGMHTAATDWIGEVPTGYSKAQLNKIQRDAQVEASAWFRSTSAVVRSYPDEFAEQACGFAQRTASQYGTAAPQIEDHILGHIASLYRTAEGTDAAGIESAADGMTNPEATDWSEEMSLPGDEAPANEAPEGIEADVYEAEWDDAAPESFIEGGTEYSSIEEPPSVTASIWSRAARQYLAAEEGTTPAQSPAEVDEEQSGEAGSTLPREVSVTERSQSFPNFMENKPAADASSERAKNISANARRKTANVVGVMSDLGGFFDEVVCRDCFDADPNAEGNIEDSDMAIQDDDEEFFGVACERCNKELPIKSPFTARRRKIASGAMCAQCDSAPATHENVRGYLELCDDCFDSGAGDAGAGEREARRRRATRKVAGWETIYQSPLVTVTRDADGPYGMEQFKVSPADGRAKTFKGETAWSDADRYASDIDFQAWGCTSRINTTPRGSLTASRKTAEWNEVSCPGCVANGTIAGEILVYENGQWVSKDCPDCVGTGNPAGVIYKNSKRKVAFEDDEFFGDDEPLALMDNPYYDFCPMCYDESLDRQTMSCVECGYTEYNTLEAKMRRRAANLRRLSAHDEATETPAEEAAETPEEQMAEESEQVSTEARRRAARRRQTRR